jgi:hypothetical protein
MVTSQDQGAKNTVTSKSKAKAWSLVKSKKANARSPCKIMVKAWTLARARQKHGHQQEQGKKHGYQQ